ncbi:hypothetical protein KI387_029625, partial [Taxus chinensis]
IPEGVVDDLNTVSKFKIDQKVEGQPIAPPNWDEEEFDDPYIIIIDVVRRKV